MGGVPVSRRTVMKAAALGLFAAPAAAAAPEPTPVTQDQIDAARREGKVAFYTAMDLPVAEKLARAFESRFPGVPVRVERTGSERLFQRIGQEQASRIFAAD